MDEVIEILEELKPGDDYETNEELVSKRVLDSLTILALVAELGPQKRTPGFFLFRKGEKLTFAR